MRDIQLYPTQQLLVREWTTEVKRPTSPAVDVVPDTVSDSTARLSASTHQPMSNTESPATESYGPADPESVSVPAELTSDGTKLVYLYLQVTGESTVGELNRSLEMKTISLLPILETLVSMELVAREGNSYLPTAA